MKQQLFGGVWAPINSAVRYQHLYGIDSSREAEYKAWEVVPMTGTISNFRVALENAPGTDNSWTLVLRKNGASTGLSVTISNDATTGEDTSTSVSLAAGDYIDIMVTPASDPVLSDIRYTLMWEGDSSVIMGGYGGGYLDWNATRYYNIQGGAQEAVTDVLSSPMPIAGNLKNLYVKYSNASGPGTSKNIICTIMVDGVASTLVATMSNASSTANDTAHTVALTAGQVVSLRVVTSTNLNAGWLAWGMEYEADGDKFPCTGAMAGVLNTGSTMYWNIPQCVSYTITQLDEDQYTALTESCVFSDLHVVGEDAPGAGKSYTCTYRKNEVDTALTCTVSDAETAGSDTSNSFQADQDDLISMSVAPSGTPDMSETWRTGVAGYIATKNLKPIIFYESLSATATFKFWDDYMSGTTDAQLDIGSSALEFKDLYIDGTSYLDEVLVGEDDTGHDVKFFGGTSGTSFLWDESEGTLILTQVDTNPALQLIPVANSITLASIDMSGYTSMVGFDITATYTSPICFQANIASYSSTPLGTAFQANLTDSTAGGARGLFVDSSAPDGYGVEIDSDIDENGWGDIYIEQTNTASNISANGQVMNTLLTFTGTDSAGSMINFALDETHAAPNSLAKSILKLLMNDASSAGPCIDIDNNGTGYAISVTDAGGGCFMELDGKWYFGDTAVHIQSDDDGHLDLTADTQIDLIGQTVIGDGGTTNYAQFAADGELTLVGTARVIREIDIPASNIAVGASGVTLAEAGGYVGYSFDIGDAMHATLEIPPDWDASTNLDVRVYWYIDEARTGSNEEVQWQIVWAACPPDASEAIDAPTHTGTIDYGDALIPTVAKYLTRVTGGTIAAASLTAGDVIAMTVSRIALDDGTGPTADPVMIRLEVEYVVNKLGEAT